MLIDLDFLVSNCPIDTPEAMISAQLELYSFCHSQDHKKAYFTYNADPYIYDSGQRLTVAFGRNEKYPDALENQLLDPNQKNITRNIAIINTLREILPSISHLYPTVTRVTLETVNGKLCHTVTEDTEEVIHYLPIPTHLSHIPTVPVTDIRKLDGLSMDVHRVKWQDKEWAFKLTGINVEGTLREISILDQLSDSPYIIKLTAIVTNRDNTIRGFITPFMHHGDIAKVLEIGRTSRGLKGDCDAIAFDWSLKLSWARQITRGVVDLHAISAYNGDLKPQNVLLDPAGQTVLIDFCPVGRTYGFAAPELLAGFNGPETALESLLTAAVDVYSLGLVLYAVAEEKSRAVLPLVWRDGQTPEWYRDTVERCIVAEPRDRPPAVEILRSLDEEGP